MSQINATRSMERPDAIPEDPYSTNPSRVFFNEDAQVIDLLEQLLEEGHVKQWASNKMNDLIVKFKDNSLTHGLFFRDIIGITFSEPLTITQEDNCKIHF